MKKITANRADIHKFLSHIRKARLSDAAAITPLVWHPVSETGGYSAAEPDDDEWVFRVCASHDTARGPEFHCDELLLGTVIGDITLSPLYAAADVVLEIRRPNDLTRKEAEALRGEVADALREHFKGGVYLFDDDLDCLRFCASRWPGKRVEALLAGLTAEQQGA